MFGGTFLIIDDDVFSEQYVRRVKNNKTQNNKIWKVPETMFVTPNPTNDEIFEFRPLIGKQVFESLIKSNNFLFNGQYSTIQTPTLLVDHTITTIDKSKKNMSKGLSNLNHKFLYVKSDPKKKTDARKVSIFNFKKNEYDQETDLIMEDTTYIEYLKKELNDNNFLCNLEFDDLNVIEDMNIDGTNIKIVGYPDPKHMFPILKYLKKYDISRNSDEYHKLSETNQNEMIKIFNYLHSDEEEKKIKEENEYYKLIYQSLELKEIIIEAKEFGISEDGSLNEQPYKELLNKELKKMYKWGLFDIDYIFHFFRVNKLGKYEILFDTVRDIEDKHVDIFIRVKEKIQKDIYKKYVKYVFNIDINENCENFLSVMRLSDIPELRVKYFHANTTFDMFTHLYQNVISLDHIIHSLKLKKSYFQNVVFEYPIKQYRVNMNQVNEKTHPNYISKSIRQDIDNSNKSIVDIELFGKIINDAKIILCNSLPNFSIEFYLSVSANQETKVYYLLLRPNIQEALDEKTINKIYLYFNSFKHLNYESKGNSQEHTPDFYKSLEELLMNEKYDFVYGKNHNINKEAGEAIPCCEKKSIMTSLNSVYKIVEFIDVAVDKNRFKKLFTIEWAIPNVVQSYQNQVYSLLTEDHDETNKKQIIQNMRDYIPKIPYLILFNGIFHFMQKKNISIDDISNQQKKEQYEKDFKKYKSEYCKKNNIKDLDCRDIILYSFFDRDLDDSGKPYLFGICDIDANGKRVWWFFRLNNNIYKKILDENIQQTDFNDLKRMNQFRSLFDIKDSDELKLIKEKIYNSKTMSINERQMYSLYTNNILCYHMSVFHIQILAHEFYKSINSKYNVHIINSTRLINVDIIINNLEIDSEYYRKMLHFDSNMKFINTIRIGSNFMSYNTP